MQLSNLEGAYDKFRQDNPRVGYFLVKLEGDNVILLTLKESDKALTGDKKVGVNDYYILKLSLNCQLGGDHPTSYNIWFVSVLAA